MPKKNVNKNPNDARALKSVRDIKNALLRLIAQKPFDQIQVEEILAEAPVQSNTFYKYFASKQAVLDAIGDDLISQMRTELETLDTGEYTFGINSSDSCQIKIIIMLLNIKEISFTDKFRVTDETGVQAEIAA